MTISRIIQSKENLGTERTHQEKCWKAAGK